VLDRREFVWRVSAAAVAVPGPLLALSAALEAQVEIPSEFDTSLDSIAVAFRAGTGTTMGYLSQPKKAGPYPGLVLLHDVAGLTAGTRGAARNVATSGYAVVAPDFLSPQGGVASFRGFNAEVTKAIAAMTPAAVAPQAIGALAFVKSHGGSGGRGTALVGFGWGATQAVLFAAGRSDVAACVAFYPDAQRVLPVLAKTSAPVLAILAGEDPETKDSAERFAQVTVAGRHPHAAKVFAGMARGFHDPGETKIYKPEPAKQAWAAAIEHLDAHAKPASTTGA